MKQKRVTIAMVEEAFQQGKAWAELNHSVEECPYTDELRHWWQRGYAYQARFFRALKAEEELMRLARKL